MPLPCWIGATSFICCRVRRAVRSISGSRIFSSGARSSHRISKYPGGFSAKYRTWRLVYYEEFGDADAAKNRELQLKGWTRVKKEWLIKRMNPKWLDLISQWEEKYGLEFRLDGRISSSEPNAKVKIDP